eukprot:scaffold795_cov187-Amphora_coffeaeformis.AAC.3
MAQPSSKKNKGWYKKRIYTLLNVHHDCIAELVQKDKKLNARGLVEACQATICNMETKAEALPTSLADKQHEVSDNFHKCVEALEEAKKKTFCQHCVIRKEADLANAQRNKKNNVRFLHDANGAVSLTLVLQSHHSLRCCW